MSYQGSLRIARVYAKAAEERENENPEEAKMFYKKALKYCGEAMEKSKSESDANFVREQVAFYKMRLKALTKPKKSNKYKERVGDDKEPKKYFELAEPKTTFDDVAGMEELKRKLERAVIWPLMYPDRFNKLVGKKSKGILLYGPPGCGKTYIAKSLAGEATKRTKKKVSFIYVKASDVLDSWVGHSEKNLRAAFETAAEKNPCILFFDELDALGGARRGRSVYADRLVNEFLTDFDIVEDKLVLVLGATNTPWEIDPALIRSGRIGRKILVEAPDKESRKELYRIHTRGRDLEKDVDFDELASLTENYTASDIAEICDLAGELALEEAIKNPNRKIEQRDFVAAISEVRSSLELWYVEAERHMRKPDIRSMYPGLAELIEKTKYRKDSMAK